MFSKFLTRHLGIAVVRRLFKMGPKMVERRLKTVRRLLHPLLVEMCAMLKNDDAYFPFLLFYYYFLNRAERGKCFGVDPVWILKKWSMLKKSATPIAFRPRQKVADANLQRRQFPTGE